MYIQGIKLKNFRNYAEQQLDFSEKFNIFYGNNAQGKTNILEAIFLCASGRSHRTQKDMDMVRMGGNGYSVEVKVARENQKTSVEVSYINEGKKCIRINEIPKKRIGDLMGQLNAVIFSPEDLMIIKEGPAGRRRFMDITISQLRPAYFFDLQQYMKILMQRNMLMKEIHDRRGAADTLDIWNMNLAKVGAGIIRNRRKFIERLGVIARNNHKKLTYGAEEIEIVYEPSIQADEYLLPEIEKKFMKVLEESAVKEITRGTTLYGPQRDDFDILLNGESLKQYGSQGQQRTAVLSLKLSEIDIMKEETGEYPVLLLDDVMSELDGNRQGYLLDHLTPVQTFITCTDKEFFCEKFEERCRLYHVEKGTVINEKDGSNDEL